MKATCFFISVFYTINVIIINRVIAEELTEYLIASQIDDQVRQVLDRTVINNMVHSLTGMTDHSRSQLHLNNPIGAF
jgi:hypothetical protein